MGIWVKLSHVRNLGVGDKLKNFALLEIRVGTSCGSGHMLG